MQRLLRVCFGDVLILTGVIADMVELRAFDQALLVALLEEMDEVSTQEEPVFWGLGRRTPY